MAKRIGDRARFVGEDEVFHYGEREGKLGTIMTDGTLSETNSADLSGECVGWQVDGEIGVYITDAKDLEIEPSAPSVSETPRKRKEAKRAN